MRLHTSTTTCIGMVLVAIISTPAPAVADTDTARTGQVAQALERPVSAPTKGAPYLTSYDGCCVKVLGVDGGRFLKGM